MSIRSYHLHTPGVIVVPVVAGLVFNIALNVLIGGNDAVITKGGRIGKGFDIPGSSS